MPPLRKQIDLRQLALGLLRRPGQVEGILLCVEHATLALK